MNKEIKIFLIEDNEEDIVLIQEAMIESKIIHKLETFHDAELAYDNILNGNVPDLILLDLNLPKMGGLEFLSELKEKEKYRKIPVIVLTNSNADNDINSAYNNYCNAYIRKPIGFEKIVQAIHATNVFWFEVVTLPKS